MYTCVNTFVCVFVKGKGTYVCVQQLAMLITHGDISNCICMCVCVCACVCVCPQYTYCLFLGQNACRENDDIFHKRNAN